MPRRRDATGTQAQEDRTMKLYATPPSPRAFKVRAVLDHLGIDVELVPLDIAGGGTRTPEFAALNPNRRMPVLDDDGFVLWESNAIMQYLAAQRPESGLWPTEPRPQADVSRWQSWELAHWDPACGTLIYERFIKRLLAAGDPDPVQIARGEERFHECAAVLDGWLAGRDWLAGDCLTLADVSVGAWLTCSELGALPVSGYREIARWYRTLESLPAWQRAHVRPLAA
jgi:glutathione S-transferase